MTDISLHMQWPLTSQPHGSVSQREQLVFHYGSNSTPTYQKSVSQFSKLLRKVDVDVEAAALVGELGPIQ
jgi:hypothetical protein